MVERFGVLGSQALVLGALWICGLLYRRLLLRIMGNPKGEDEEVAWAKANRIKGALLAAPTLIIFAPATEELLFRAPLIAALDTVEGTRAWSVVIASAVVFGLVHFDRFVDRMVEIRDVPMGKGVMLLARSVRTTFVFALGLIVAYYGITQQSLFLAFGIHAAWNAVFLTGVPAIIMALLAIVPFFIGDLALAVRDRLSDAWRSARYRIRHRHSGSAPSAPRQRVRWNSNE